MCGCSSARYLDDLLKVFVPFILNQRRVPVVEKAEMQHTIVASGCPKATPVNRNQSQGKREGENCVPTCVKTLPTIELARKSRKMHPSRTHLIAAVVFAAVAERGMVSPGKRAEKQGSGVSKMDPNCIGRRVINDDDRAACWLSGAPNKELS